METWTDLFNRAFDDAKLLRDAGSYRAAISRAYYALYYAIAARLRTGTSYAHGWSNPSHSQVPGLIAQVPGLETGEKEALRELWSLLFRDRVRADYQPWYGIEREEAREAFVTLSTALAILKEKV